MSTGRHYTILQGDCLSSIAEREGFLWHMIWNDPNNSKLRDLRKDPNVLKPGDNLWIPSLKLKEEDCQTEATHNFVVMTDSVLLRLRLLNNDRPRADQDYKLLVERRTISGTTDSEGRIEHRIPASSRRGRLELISEGEVIETYQLQLGHLNPADDVLGIQQRLRNLGYFCELTGEFDDRTKAAAMEFRQKHRLPQSEEIDSKFLKILEQKHGS